MGEGPFFNMMDSLTIDSLWRVLKWGYVLAFTMYVAFSLVVMAQVRQMLSAFKAQLNGAIRFVSLIHFFVAVGALLVAIVIL